MVNAEIITGSGCLQATPHSPLVTAALIFLLVISLALLIRRIQICKKLQNKVKSQREYIRRLKYGKN